MADWAKLTRAKQLGKGQLVEFPGGSSNAPEEEPYAPTGESGSDLLRLGGVFLVCFAALGVVALLTGGGV